MNTRKHSPRHHIIISYINTHTQSRCFGYTLIQSVRHLKIIRWKRAFFFHSYSIIINIFLNYDYSLSALILLDITLVKCECLHIYY